MSPEFFRRVSTFFSRFLISHMSRSSRSIPRLPNTHAISRIILTIALSTPRRRRDTVSRLITNDEPRRATLTTCVEGGKEGAFIISSHFRPPTPTDVGITITASQFSTSRRVFFHLPTHTQRTAWHFARQPRMAARLIYNGHQLHFARPSSRRFVRSPAIYLKRRTRFSRVRRIIYRVESIL